MTPQVTYSWLGNTSFSSSNLNATAKYWYDELQLQDITDTTQYDNAASVSDDVAGLDPTLQSVGYLLHAVWNAFRVTGDLDLLDTADILANELKTPLITNGYFITPATAPYEHASQNELAGLLAQMTYIYYVNRGLDSPANGAGYYNNQYSAWNTYLTGTYLPAFGAAPYIWSNRILRHRGSAYMRFLWYMWKLGGDPDDYWRYDDATGPQAFYGMRAMNYAAERADFPNADQDAYHMGQDIVSPNRYRMDHEFPYHWGITDHTTAWAPSHYFRYSMQNFVDFYLSGVYLFNDTTMTRYANTCWWCMEDGVDNIKDRVYGDEETGDMTAGQWRVSGLILGSKWSSDLLTFATNDYANVVDTNLHYPAHMLVSTI